MEDEEIIIEDNIESNECNSSHCEEINSIGENEEESMYDEQGLLIVKETGFEAKFDKKKQVCWDLYVQSVIAGNPNARAAAVKAGFAYSTADKISSTKWFKERKDKLKRNGMLSRAEKNLEKVLNLNYKVLKQKDNQMVEEINTDILKIVVDVSKSIVKSLGKDEGYSDRSEVTGKSGDPIVFMPAELLNKFGLDK